MRIVICPSCEHQNRSAIVATICDRCGDDISTVTPGNQVEEAFEPEPEETRSEPTEAPAPGIALEAKPAATSRGSIMLFSIRLLVAGGMVAASVWASLRVPLGSALAGDAMLAGSVAILGGAAAVSGLIMIVIGAERKSSGMTLGMRLVGMMLAFIGTWCVATIATQGGLDRRSDPSDRGIQQDYQEQFGMPGGPGSAGGGGGMLAPGPSPGAGRPPQGRSGQGQ